MGIIKKLVNDFFDLNTLKHLSIVVLFISLISAFNTLDIKQIDAQENQVKDKKQLSFSVYQQQNINSNQLFAPGTSSSTIESSGVSIKKIENTKVVKL